MMMDHFHFQLNSASRNYDSLYRNVVDAIIDRILKFQQRRQSAPDATRDKKLAIGLSSGFTFIPIHRMLRDEIRTQKINLSNVVFFLADDRFAPSDHPDANSHKYLLQDLPNATLYYPRVDTLQLEECVNAYNKQIRELLKETEHGKFDLVAMKMGEFCQILGLYPPVSQSNMRPDEEHIIVKTQTDKRPISDRITLTLDTLENKCNHIVMLLNKTSKHVFWDKLIPALDNKEQLKSDGAHFSSSVLEQYPVANLLLKKSLTVVYEDRDTLSLA